MTPHDEVMRLNDTGKFYIAVNSEGVSVLRVRGVSILREGDPNPNGVVFRDPMRVVDLEQLRDFLNA